MSDEARDAKAEAAAAKARAKALRPWYKKKRTWALGILAVLIVIPLASGGGDSKKDDSTDVSSDVVSASRNSDNPPERDVVVTTCEKGQFGPTVKVRITNHSSKRSNYLVSANLENAAGDKVGEANGASNNIDPGQSAEADMLGTSTGEFTRCVVKSVNRYASS